MGKPNREGTSALSPAVADEKADNCDNVGYFLPMLQGNATNFFAHADVTESRFNVDTLIHNATFRDERITVTANAPRTLTVSAKKLFDRLAAAFTDANGYGECSVNTCSVHVSLNEYASLCGQALSEDAVKNLRRKVKADLYKLSGITLEWRERKSDDFMKMSLISSVGIRNGNIVAEFSQSLANYLTHAYVMNYPSVLFRLDERCPSAYYIGRKLALHYSTNRGTSEKIGVRSLLESCPSLPAYENIKSKDRHYKRKIMNPFERALNTLIDTHLLESWNYCGRDGRALSASEKEGLTYAAFVECLVCFRLKDAPTYEKKPLLEKTHKRSVTQNTQQANNRYSYKKKRAVSADDGLPPSEENKRMHSP